MSEGTFEADGGQWWLSQQGIVTGPHSQAYVEVALRTGTLSPQTYACPVGAQVWHRLSDCPAFASSTTGTTRVPASPLPPQPPLPAAPHVREPWNPQTIAWLGLLFSPIWAGIMAAVNTRRLRLDLPIWRPIAIGVGATFLDLFIEVALFESWFFSLLLYCGTVWLIWYVDLRPQVESFHGGLLGGRRTANWVVPAMAGAPAALFVFFAYVVNPLLPLEPREVCERFAGAASLNAAKQYTTTNLWPALEALDALEDEGTFVDNRLDLTDEGPAPEHIGGYLVGCRMFFRDAGTAHTMEGFFHLVNYEGVWKIEEWYLVPYEQESPVPLSVAYTQLLPAIRDVPSLEVSVPVSPPTSDATVAAPSAAKPEENEPYLVGVLPRPIRPAGRWVYRWFGFPGLIVFIVFAVIAAICLMVEQQNKNG